MQKETIAYQPNNDAKVRIAVVGEQREIEDKLHTGSAMFVVPSLLTPMFIAPDNVVLDDADKLYKMKGDDKTSIPDGLIPDEKLQDAKQLSTVLGRVLSLRAMLDRGVEVTILHVSTERPKADKKPGSVDSTEVEKLKQKYKNLHLKTIPQELYARYQTQVCAATYCDEESGEKRFTGIDASQINSTAAHHNWGVKAEPGVLDKISHLDELLIFCYLEPINPRKIGSPVM